MGGKAVQEQADLFPEIVGRSAGLRKVLDLVARIAPSDSGVLIQGESGTGKELIAAAVHRLSARNKQRMLAINCSAIPENLLESELFGHEKGAFTGADRTRRGYFELATGGTVFLDEIGDMTLHLQSKLLRVLQEKKYIRLGGTETRTADVRIIAATNIELEEEIKDGGKFRLDLYYRLNALPVRLPPLRERKEDIEDLLLHFLKVYNRSCAPKIPCFFHPTTIALLRDYAWPGNVRQLQNLVERLILTTGGGELCINNLPVEFLHTQKLPALPPATASLALPVAESRCGASAFGKPGFKLTEHVQHLENQYILEALRSTGNNKNKAARILGLNRTTLVERIKKRRLNT